MTHPTDEELDALVKRLTWAAGIDQSEYPFPMCNEAADAITSLRAQLAEARTELVRRVDMHECAMTERDDATLYSDEQKARADRAEATLASLIEDAAQIAEAERKLWDRGYDTSPEGFAACRALAKARDSILALDKTKGGHK